MPTIRETTGNVPAMCVCVCVCFERECACVCVCVCVKGGGGRNVEKRDGRRREAFHLKPNKRIHVMWSPQPSYTIEQINN